MYAQTIQAAAVPSKAVAVANPATFDKDLFRFLLATRQADGADAYPALYKVLILVKAQHPAIGVYKFGINSAHMGYNVVFRYRDKLIFSRAEASGPLLTLFGNFMTRYPSSYSLEEQKKAAAILLDIVEANRNLAKQDF